MLRGECAWVCVAERGVCVVGRGWCASVNSEAGNCRTCVIAFQPTIQRVVCLLLFLRVIVIVNCTVTLLSTHTHSHTHSCILCVVFLVGVSIQLANIAARGAFAIETEDVLDATAHAHALFEACGSCGTTGSWQLSQHSPRQRTLLWQRLPYQRRQIKDKQLTWLYNLFICILRHATKSNLLIANVSDAKRNYSHPHGKVATRFQVEPSSVECASVCSFIQKDSFAFAIRLREASSRLAPLLSPSSFPLSCCCLRQFMRITFSHFREWLNIVYSAATPSYGPCGRDVGACNWLGPWRKILFNHLASEKFSS